MVLAFSTVIELADAYSATVYEPQNKIYTQNTVSLVFSYSPTYRYPGETAPGGFYYVLDGQKIFFTPSFNGSAYRTIITGLADGNHTLIVYFETYIEGTIPIGGPTYITHRTETVKFSVTTAETTPSPSPSTTPTPMPTPSISPPPTPTPTPTATTPPSSAEMPLFSMPKEYLNYTITTKDGAPWAVIEGVYPIYCSNADEQDTIAMVYPTPPGTTNISIKLNGVLLNWSDFAEQYPDGLHHTAIGDWSIIGTAFEPSGYFILSIHYEHPIMQANGSYQFLYDLNISPYLSASNPSSTAYFTLKIDNAYSNIKVFTVPSDSTRNPMEYVSQGQGALREVTFAVTSEYATPLPGDVIVTFDEAATGNQTFPTLTVAVVLGVALFAAAAMLIAVILSGRKKRSRMLL